MMKKRYPCLFVPILLVLATLAASPASPTDEVENYRQIKTMPLERRVALLENLERFDKLGPVEQAKIRKLEAEIASKPLDEQAEKRTLMRRYELWVSSLSEEQIERLRAIEDPHERLDLAIQFRKDELKAGTSAHRIHGIRSGYYGLMGPTEAANLLQIWNRMDSAQKAEAERRSVNNHLSAEIHAMAQKVGFKPHRFTWNEELKYDALLDKNEDFKKQVGKFSTRVDAPQDKAAKSKGEHSLTRFQIHFAEFLYFEDNAHKQKKVSQENLAKFAAFCPNWFHSMIDPLSADDARNYLMIVYRLIFPDSEITPDWKPARDKSQAILGAPRPTPKRGLTPAPF